MNILTDPQLFTRTINGQLINIKFYEESLIKVINKKQFVGFDSLVSAKCNYGFVQNKIYKEIGINNNNIQKRRGRKKKIKIKKNRKIQGNGSSFNSQITFRIKYFDRIYSMKLFRTGKYGIHGLIDTNIENHNNIIDILCKYLNYLFDRSLIKNDLITVEYYQIVMSNYKLCIKSYNKFFINLINVYNILKSKRDIQVITKSKYIIYMINYNTQRSNLTFDLIKIIDNKIDNKVKVIIYLSGKINMLGNTTDDMKQVIYNLLHNMIIYNGNDIINSFYQPKPLLPDIVKSK